jgi:hypothetical protein
VRRAEVADVLQCCVDEERNQNQTWGWFGAPSRTEVLFHICGEVVSFHTTSTPGFDGAVIHKVHGAYCSVCFVDYTDLATYVPVQTTTGTTNRVVGRSWVMANLTELPGTDDPVFKVVWDEDTGTSMLVDGGLRSRQRWIEDVLRGLERKNGITGP